MTAEAARGGVTIRLLGLALLICMAGLTYAHLQSIPAGLAVPLAAAFTLEGVLYAACGWDRARRRIERGRGPAQLAALSAASAIVPYLLYAPWCGVFRWSALAELAALAAAVSFWFVIAPRRPALNLLFIAALAVPLLARRFEGIYGVPAPGLSLGVLGQVMWTRTAVFAILSIARIEVKGIGFLPSFHEWKTGVLNFALFLPAGAALAWATGFAAYDPRREAWWLTLAITAGTFLGMLWVVALREEFFFRGLLQQWFEDWTGRAAVAVALASVLFGLVHLPFRGFPNWRFVLVASAAGVFYGRAYWQARSVRAAMVTHALVNTAWKVFFS
jgi:membrane protease YdiL (CAAX protease family)